MHTRPMGAEQEFGLRFLANVDISNPQAFGELLAGVNGSILNQVALAQQVSRSGNMWLGNGARCYRDNGQHIEYATPECTDVLDVVAHILAGRRILAAATTVANETDSSDTVKAVLVGLDYAFDQPVPVPGDAQAKDWRDLVKFGGCHGNYSVDTASAAIWLRPPNTESVRLRALATHLATQILYTGNGWCHPESGVFRLGSRVKWLTEMADSTSTRPNYRPLINTRKESHEGDGSAIDRLHLICGNANVAQAAIVLQFGITSLLLRLIEEHPERLAQLPILHDLGEDPGLVERIATLDGFRERYRVMEAADRTPLDIQRTYVEVLDATFGSGADDPAHVAKRNRQVLDLAWETTDAIARDPFEIDGLRDWPVKLALFQRHLRRTYGLASFDGLPSEAVRDLLYLDALYHDCGSASDAEAVRVWQKRMLRQIVTKAQVVAAETVPPGLSPDVSFPPIRSATRGRLIQLVRESRTYSASGMDWSQVTLSNKRSHEQQTIKLPRVLEYDEALLAAWEKKLRDNEHPDG